MSVRSTLTARPLAPAGGVAGGDARAERDVERLAGALGDENRRRAYFAIKQAGQARSKDEIAAELGIDRRLAGFHLDKLVEAGFLAPEFRRRGGAGRPAKYYRAANPDIQVELPARQYQLLAALLLRAAAGDGGLPQESLERIGYEFGLETGRARLAGGEQPGVQDVHQVARGLAAALSHLGFAAEVDAEGGVTACACPFEELALADPKRVCGLDRAIWRGVLAATSSGVSVHQLSARAEGDEECRAELMVDA